MSLDISLYVTEEDGTRTEVWARNVTHNLNTMASEAGLYEVMWRPDEIGVKTAREAIPLLKQGISKLVEYREPLEKLNPENGWGSYEGLRACATEYYSKCKQYPNAEIEVDR